MTGILLVHGAWHGPWCWNNFMEDLAGRGYDARAVRLRGHDRPRGRIWHRIHHYIEDVREAATGFSAPPFLVGHSMGGLVVQRYLECHAAPGAVLLASVPTRGIVGAVARQAVRHPAAMLKSVLLLRLSPFVSTLELARDLFFTPNTPQEIIKDCFANLQDESFLAFLDMIALLPRPGRVQAPILVIGADCDSMFTVGEMRRTAQAYRTEALIFAGIGHDMMLDNGWVDVAARIDLWVRQVLRAGAQGAHQSPPGP
jgi:alpha-beta hydrolase superfamily lysophospholipase